MKAIATDALIMETARQREHRCDVRLRMVEGRIEAGDLRQRRMQARHRFDRQDGMRLMQRRQRNERAQSRDDICIDCLLYTSDAADEEDSVDLGGRRIIKKKK